MRSAERRTDGILRKIDKCDKCGALSRYQRNHLEALMVSAFVRALAADRKQKKRGK